jgi:NAD+ diphosphatase
MAASVPSRQSPDYAAFTLANLVFGGYFSSRWVANIREDKGYTYSPHAQVEHPPAGSRVSISADVSTPTTAPALLETLYELGRVATTPVGQGELDQARRYAVGTLALGTSTQAGLASTLSQLAGAGLGIGYLREYPEQLAAVTVDSALEAAGRYLAPNRLTTVLVRRRQPGRGARCGRWSTSSWPEPMGVTPARVPALSRASVDRDAATRDDPAALSAAWSDARVLVLQDGQALVDEADRPRLVLVDPGTATAAAPDGERLYLGRDAGGPVFAVTGQLPRALGARPLGLREVGALLDDRDAGCSCTPSGWPTGTPPTRAAALRRGDRGGARRLGPPLPGRRQPALPAHRPGDDRPGARRRDRCVLGRQAVWPAGRFSTLAGFVEPGESAEQSVVREVAEETGLVVDTVEYVASQPWPFPASLMLGFRARCDPDAVPHPVDGELEEARWFTRDEVRAAATWGAGEQELQLPSAVSIARLLLDGWVGEG